MIQWVKRLKRERYELTGLESLESGQPVRDEDRRQSTRGHVSTAWPAWYARAAKAVRQDDAIG